MPTGRSTPPKGAGKAAAIIAAILVLMGVVTFVGMNFQHASALRDEQSGQVKPEDMPKSEIDHGVSPVKQK